MRDTNLRGKLLYAEIQFKRLKVNPMVIIGKSKVKACKTLPYTTLSFHFSHLLSPHRPAILITTYHYAAYQRETEAGCIA